MDYSVKVKNVTKEYKLYKDKWGPIKELLSTKTLHKKFLALNDVSLELPKGEAIGVLGRNGSGKSTLLKIITGIADANIGEVEVNGSLVFLDVSSGIDPELTGYDNIFLKGTLLGYTESEMAKKVDSIIEFSELDEFIYQPVKNYSSGMKSKLGFAISVNVNPDILIVDEALAVGDSRFRKKCMTKMNQFKDEGKTIIFVSHDSNAIESFCSKAAWLHQGRLIGYGNAKKVGEVYNAFMKDEIDLERAELLISHTASLEGLTIDSSTLDLCLSGKGSTINSEKITGTMALKIPKCNYVINLSKNIVFNESFSTTINFNDYLTVLSGYDFELGVVIKHGEGAETFIPFENHLNVNELNHTFKGQMISLKNSRNVTLSANSIASLDQQATTILVKDKNLVLEGRYLIKENSDIQIDKSEAVLVLVNSHTNTIKKIASLSEKSLDGLYTFYKFKVDLSMISEGEYKLFLHINYKNDKFVKKQIWSSLKSYQLSDYYLIDNKKYTFNTDSKWLEMTITEHEV